MAQSVVPAPAARPNVLPTDRLQENGMCRPELREEIRRIHDKRNAASVAGLWLAVSAVVALAVWIDNPVLYGVAFLVMGPLYVRFAILMHEAAHKLLFTNKRVNDWVGTWLIGYPAWVPIGLYRRGHFATPSRGVRSERPRPRLLRRLPLRPPHAAAPTGARRRRHLGVEEFRSPPQVRPLPRGPAHHPAPPGRPGAALGDLVGGHRDAGGSTPCCGGCRG